MESDAIEQVSKELLRQLLTVQIELGDLSQERERIIRASLIELASNCLPDYIENCVKSGNPLENQPIDFLTITLCQRFVAHTQTLVKKNFQLENVIIPGIKQALSLAEATCMEKQSQINELEFMIKTNSKFSQSDEIGNVTKVPAQELTKIAQLFRQSETYERDREALGLIGTSGYSRVPVIKEMLAKKWNVATSKARSIDECLNRLCEKALIVIELKTEQEQTSSGGRYPHILSLTAPGVAVYKELFNALPSPGEYTEFIKRHKSPEHTLLILQVADFFESVGYTVNRFPERYRLDGGHYAEPDLEFQNIDGKIKLLEVERGGNKSNRINKWLNLYYAGTKEIYVVTDNKKTMIQIRSEISNVLGTKEGLTYLSNMFELLKGTRGDNNSIWLDIRER